MAGSNAIIFHSCFIIASILCNYLVGLLATGSGSGGFTVELIRRDSLKSPFGNANTERLDTFFPRRLEGVNSNTPQTIVKAYKGQHIMKLSIGTPPVDIYNIADTGSDLFWTQCLPCEGCYKQIYPMFNPQKSSTYSDISCQSDQCHELNTKCSPKNLCEYVYGYGDSSTTRGFLAKETVALTSTTGEKVSANVVFGCGHNNTGTFNDHEMGIIGLGGGVMSFTSQMGAALGSRKFSHCLSPFGTDPNIPSKISFGSGSEVLGDGVVSTPLIQRGDTTSYFVTLKGISVGDKYLSYDPSDAVSEGNVFLDSGAPPMLMPEDLHNRLEAEVKKQIPLAPVVDDPELGTQLCYKSAKNLDGPILTLHFEGADVKLPPSNFFIPPPKQGFFCLAVQNFGPAESGFGIIGNFAQSNYLIGYDMEKMMLSFKQTDCTKN
ncbi:aspartic proteinase CDR1-like [Corylus avellana]|uniref:aspartic proteinase CDR1-like n=1 Tax=Corylus avellana TaxID=13451 RepID=UPI001E216D1D|nr:aspartic proteinase CDR1-like [Corylus avellana]